LEEENNSLEGRIQNFLYGVLKLFSKNLRKLKNSSKNEAFDPLKPFPEYTPDSLDCKI
jgi:hypothetical protein